MIHLCFSGFGATWHLAHSSLIVCEVREVQVQAPLTPKVIQFQIGSIAIAVDHKMLNEWMATTTRVSGQLCARARRTCHTKNPMTAIAQLQRTPLRIIQGCAKFHYRCYGNDLNVYLGQGQWPMGMTSDLRVPSLISILHIHVYKASILARVPISQQPSHRRSRRSRRSHPSATVWFACKFSTTPSTTQFIMPMRAGLSDIRNQDQDYV